MSRASTVKPPALAMPSRRAAVSAGFPVRRRRPDAGDCRHQGEYAGACPFWTGSLFLCLFSFFLLPKGRYLPKHGLRGGLFRIRAGRAGERPRPGRRPQARRAVTRRYRVAWCLPAQWHALESGKRCSVYGRLSHGSCRSLWSGKPHAVQGPAAQAVFLRMDGKRRTARAWRDGYCRMGGSSRRALLSRPWLSVDRAERPER